MIGYPGDLGGACTELWHTLKLWRDHGVDCRLVQTWGPAPSLQKARCDAIGCQSLSANPTPAELRALGLAGQTVVSFCNGQFLSAAGTFHELGCRVVWVNCMNWIHPAELRLLPVFGPFAAYVFQSGHQQETLGPQLARYGARPSSFHRIPGPLDPAEFSYQPRPRKPGEPMVYGRLSRAAANKYSTNTWPIYQRIDYPRKRYRVLGWAPELAASIGAPPVAAGVEILAEQAEPADRFFSTLHAMLQINGVENENWPRSGLEAMASGVPVIVEARGGWQEMIQHGETGFCCESDAELAHWAAHLAYDDAFRLRIAAQARQRLIDHLANPTDLWTRWQSLFMSLT